MQEIGLTTYNEDLLYWDTVGRRPAGPLCRAVTEYIDCPTDATANIPLDQKHAHGEIKFNCHDMMCRACSKPLAFARSAIVWERLSQIQTEWYLRGYRLDFYHFILSPPPESYYDFSTFKGLKRIERMAAAKWRELGVVGGYQVIHRVRGTDKQIRDYQDHRIKLAASWHWHNVGFGPAAPIIEPGGVFPDGWRYVEGYSKSPALYSDDEWVFKMKDIAADGGARNVINYEIKHAALYSREPDGRLSNVIRPMGIASPKYSDAKPWTEILRRDCEVCGRELVRHIDGFGVEDATVQRKHKRVKVTDTQMELAARKYAMLANGPRRSSDLSAWTPSLPESFLGPRAD